MRNLLEVFTKRFKSKGKRKGLIHQSDDTIEKLTEDIKTFVKLSLKDDEVILRNWTKEISSDVESFCYLVKKCAKKDCLAYKQ